MLFWTDFIIIYNFVLLHLHVQAAQTKKGKKNINCITKTCSRIWAKRKLSSVCFVVNLVLHMHNRHARNRFRHMISTLIWTKHTPPPPPPFWSPAKHHTSGGGRGEVFWVQLQAYFQCAKLIVWLIYFVNLKKNDLWSFMHKKKGYNHSIHNITKKLE